MYLKQMSTSSEIHKIIKKRNKKYVTLIISLQLHTLIKIFLNRLEYNWWMTQYKLYKKSENIFKNLTGRGGHLRLRDGHMPDLWFLVLHLHNTTTTNAATSDEQYLQWATTSTTNHEDDSRNDRARNNHEDGSSGTENFSRNEDDVSLPKNRRRLLDVTSCLLIIEARANSTMKRDWQSSLRGLLDGKARLLTVFKQACAGTGERDASLADDFPTLEKGRSFPKVLVPPWLAGGWTSGEASREKWRTNGDVRCSPPSSPFVRSYSSSAEVKTKPLPPLLPCGFRGPLAARSPRHSLSTNNG